MLGYTREEYVGQHISKFHVDRDVIDDALSRLLRGDSLSKFPARMRHRNGSIKKVHHRLQQPVGQGALHPQPLLDVRRHASRNEKKKRDRCSPPSSRPPTTRSSSKTLEGIILSWNQGAQRLFGYSPAEAVGRSIDLIIPPELRPEEREILSGSGKATASITSRPIRVTKDGRRLDISLTVSPVRDDSGRVIGASKVARDITERKQMDEALREADRRKDEFLATLAHELRNPLAPIRHSRRNPPQVRRGSRALPPCDRHPRTSAVPHGSPRRRSARREPNHARQVATAEDASGSRIDHRDTP